ncbi:transcription factor TFIIIC subunit tfc4 [Mortierella sp. NVP85]|nr:transcription factor TFIIIC subunit tfc4 [Mortierella sp. NVP85]
MDSSLGSNQGSSANKGPAQSSASNSTGSGDTSLIRNDSFANELLAGLATSFQEEHGQRSGFPKASGNPLLARLNQDSAERAHIAAVGHQLGPEGTKAPQVIGDYAGLSSSSSGWSGKAAAVHSTSSGDAQGSGSTSLDDALGNIRLGGEDDEVNELDDDEDMATDFTQGSSIREPGRMTEAMRAEAMSAASAVDPQQLMGAARDEYAILGSWRDIEGFDPSQVEDDDELDENDPALEELGLSLAPKSHKEKKKQRRKGEVIYPPEVQRLLGMANHAYVSRDYKQAVDLFQQVIVTHPNVFQAWNIMGVIQEELGNPEKALQLYLVAAHLTPKDGALWKKLAAISKNCGYDQQALYCFSRAYRADKNDMDALWDRSIMYQVLGQPNKAIQGFQKLLKVKQHYMPALEELVKIYSSLDQDNRRYRENMHQAMVDYEAAYLHYSSLPDRFANLVGDPFDVTDEDEIDGPLNEPFGYSALNMLSELYIMFEEYEKPIKMIKSWSRRLQRRSHQTWWDDYKDDREFDTDPDDEEFQASLGENRTRGLPVDLRVKLGICRLMMEEVKEAKAQFKYLWRCSVEDFPDLYEEIAELYMSRQMWKDAYNVIKAMLQYDEMDIPKIWTMAGECLRQLGQLKEAKDFLEQAHRTDPSSVDVSMMLAEVYEEMGNLPQALTLVNYVRQANAEKQVEAERRRREARQARSKEGPFAAVSTSETFSQEAYSSAYPQDPRYRSIAPRAGEYSGSSAWQPGSDAARALERITEASRSNAAAERYSSADRDRDIKLLKNLREQERAEKLAEREAKVHDLRDVIEKFNNLDIVYQRIDQKERSQIWENKREAVIATRKDRTQYILAARELINIFRNNRGFFPKEKNKPYMGVETRTWRYRRSANDVDAVLSEHVTEMAERLGRAMGVTPEKPPAEEALEHGGVIPPTSYKEVSFDAWYLLMIRQAVYLTYEDRYAEATEILMIMFRANVFYSVPRRRSGIILVLLSCAMWAGDCGASLNAGRWLVNFGGTRPLPVKIYQAVFTLGPRHNQKFFGWVQNVTYKYLRRHIGRMRAAIGKGNQKLMRKQRTTARRKPPPGHTYTRGPNKVFRTLPVSMSSSNKRLKGDTSENQPDGWTPTFPWRAASNFSQPKRRLESNAAQNSVEQQAHPPTDKPAESTAAATSSTESTEFDKTQEADMSIRSLRTRVSFSDPTRNDPNAESSHPSTTTVSTRKRPLEEEEEDAVELGDAEGTLEDDAVQDDQEIDDEKEGTGDDDDYDIDDDAYKTEDDDGEGDGDDDGDTDWERSTFSRSNVFGKNRRLGVQSADDDDDDDDDDDGFEDDDALIRRRPKRRHKGSNRNAGSGTGPEDDEVTVSRLRTFTKEVYPAFHLGMVMFSGHILAQSRSHIGSAAQFLECLDYAPYNPAIHLYASIQFLNLAMQRTTTNRQVTTAQGMLFLQNYYRLRMAGYGTLAFAEREREYKAKGKIMPPHPIDPVRSVIGVENVDEQQQEGRKDETAEISADTAAIASSEPPAKGHKQKATKRPSISGHGSSPLETSSAFNQSSKSARASASSSARAGTTSEAMSITSEEDDPPLTHAQQEAEYNYARCFQQMGQNQLAIFHYQRVLELPSWREVQREHEALREKRVAAEKEAKKVARMEERAKKLEKKKKVVPVRVTRSRKAAKMAELNHSENEGHQEEEEEEEEANRNELDEPGSEEEDEAQAAQSADSSKDGLFSKIQLQGVHDEDPTDLKREAAFNLAKIYIQSGAMGEAQLLMRKYCTI